MPITTTMIFAFVTWDIEHGGSFFNVSQKWKTIIHHQNNDLQWDLLNNTTKIGTN